MAATSSSDTDVDWTSLPADILGSRIFQQLPLRARCATIPLVCKSFNRVHLARPPVQKRWLIKKRIGQVTLGMVSQTAASIQSLEVFLDRTKTPGILPQLLAVLGPAAAPRLVKLSLRLPVGHFDQLEDSPGGALSSLPLLSQIRQLKLRKLPYGDDDVPTVLGLSGLRSLQELEISFETRKLTEGGAEALWEGLASLGGLRKLAMKASPPEGLDIMMCMSAAGTRVFEKHSIFLFNGVSRLTQISCLEIKQGLEGFALPPDSIGALTQLTRLELGEKLPSGAFGGMGVLALPQLRELELRIDDGSYTAKYNRMPPQGLPVQSRSLTLLSLKGVSAASTLEALLPPASAPALPTLKHLALRLRWLSEVTTFMTAALVGLTELHLENTKLTELPAALSLLTNLQVLHLSDNLKMQLRQSDLDVLGALPGLKVLRMEDMNLEEDSMLVVDAMRGSHILICN